MNMAKLLQAIIGCVFGLIILAAAWGGGRYADYMLRSELQAQAQSSLALAENGLRNELDKQRIVPLLLAADTDILRGLKTANADFTLVNRKLAQLAKDARSTVIYLLDKDGNTLSSSNYAEPWSFIDYDFSYRLYYMEAMQKGFAEQFAYGSVSQEPGLYFARRIGTAENPLGVVVVKLNSARIENEWAISGNIVLITDKLGVVLISTGGKWRFHSLWPLSPRQIDLERQRYSPALPLDVHAISVKALGDGMAQFDDGVQSGRYMQAHSNLRIASNAVKMTALLSVDQVWSVSILQAQLIGGFCAAFILLAVSWALRRAERLRRHRRILQRRAQELEAGVRERTTALLASNERLREEIEERQRVEDRMILLREELAQANRLTTLGQITAGLAHEINQPLAAIRTFAENGRKFLHRENVVKADENYGTIIGLTDRLAAITESLRNFARRGQQKVQRLDVADPLKGALLILSTPLKQSGIKLVKQVPETPLYICVDRVRLEQVLVNLLRNARDALANRENAVIRITVERVDGRILICVADNGAGIDDNKREQLFKPFFSTRTSGLGLGLVISGDIIREFDGKLSVARDKELGGAVFTIDLPEAL